MIPVEWSIVIYGASKATLGQTGVAFIFTFVQATGGSLLKNWPVHKVLYWSGHLSCLRGAGDWRDRGSIYLAIRKYH
jgi:hypothetical protein